MWPVKWGHGTHWIIQNKTNQIIKKIKSQTSLLALQHLREILPNRLRLMIRHELYFSIAFWSINRNDHIRHGTARNCLKLKSLTVTQYQSGMQTILLWGFERKWKQCQKRIPRNIQIINHLIIRKDQKLSHWVKTPSGQKHSKPWHWLQA